MAKSAALLCITVLLISDALAVSLVPLRQHRTIDITGPVCRNGDWLVVIKGIPECVKPLWNTRFDRTHCKRVVDGWVTCSCKLGFQLAAVENGVDSCVDTEIIQEGGYCILKPCPEEYECRDIERYRFDCIKGNIIVPNWYAPISTMSRK
ncbi:uncharacterized protein LOC115098293 isoform X2 [Rhinatrema bivittatum]|uniref:uncharacterized protein LOC115098293 isoform X2 n=1 Tax=Rhinatrema bivittatum TaxID=194408 RepID=UPI001126B1A4|nr:uncharacterized protein LOC115098293 isoform X2 [Rhinatrema bivittatum]